VFTPVVAGSLIAASKALGIPKSTVNREMIKTNPDQVIKLPDS
jgi:hypothetical protein